MYIGNTDVYNFKDYEEQCDHINCKCNYMGVAFMTSNFYRFYNILVNFDIDS